MELRPNRVRRKLEAGEPAFVVGGVTHADDIDALGPIGFDGIWLEGEHGGVDAADLGNLTRACDIWGMTSLVRVNRNDQGLIYRTLDRGAQAIVVPHVDTRADAENVVAGGKFPPLGKRGMDGAGADADYALANPREYLEHVAQEVFLVFQIEDKEAVEAIDEIADVEGFDVFFVGMGDLSLSYGVPFDFGNPILQEALERVAEAARKTGRWWGTPTGNPEHAQRIINLGGRMVTAGGDHMALLKGFQKSFEDFSSVRLPG